MRNLASIQRVVKVSPIVGADRIETVSVLGWDVVCAKDEFKVNDLVIYFEVDSFLNAEDPRYASFTERFSNWNGKRGMRIKTIRLRKQISQGLIMTISDFKEFDNMNLVEGLDATELLKIEKWESIEDSVGGNSFGNMKQEAAFPSFIFKTDQERVQNRINELSKHKDEDFEVTIKLDGSSMTVYCLNENSKYFKDEIKNIERRLLKRRSKLYRLFYYLKKKFGFVEETKQIIGVCSRNVSLKLDSSNIFVDCAKDNGLLFDITGLNRNLAFQGELIGPTIQNNFESVKENQFYVYDVFDIDAQKYLLPEQASTLVNSLNWNYVPVLHTKFKLPDKEDPKDLVTDILEMAEGTGMNPGVKREGLVFKSNQSQLSFKAISNSYLLAKEKKQSKEEA